MKHHFIGHPIIHLECIDSTNNYAANLLKAGKISSGTVIMADEQTDGRGQRGKIWQSDAFTNLLVTFVGELNQWKIDEIISINHIIALATQKFIENYTQNVQIKWPNDIMVNGKKIAGILIENKISNTKRFSIIGCGININQTILEHPRSTSLFLETQKTYSPKQLLSSFIQILNQTIQLYQDQGEKYIFDAFNKVLWKKGIQHPFYYNNEKKIGKISTTNMEGQLIVAFKDSTLTFTNGEVRH